MPEGRKYPSGILGLVLLLISCILQLWKMCIRDTVASRSSLNPTAHRRDSIKGQRLNPFFQLRFGSTDGETLAGQYFSAFGKSSNPLLAFTELASAGGEERNDGLTGEVICLQEAVDDTGLPIPPDGKAEKNDGCIGNRSIVAGQRRTAVGVLHLHGGAGLLIHPVQIFLLIRDGGADLIQLGTCRAGERVGQFGCASAGREKRP